MIIPMLCVTIFVILVVWFLLPRVARLMIYTPTAISIFVCLSMVQLMAVFISIRCLFFCYVLYYLLDIVLMVLAAEGSKANDSHADCYQYFCVPEYGTANGRLHFHAVHFMRTLPTGSVDPNFGRRVRNRRQLNSLQNTWPYG